MIARKKTTVPITDFILRNLYISDGRSNRHTPHTICLHAERSIDMSRHRILHAGAFLIFAVALLIATGCSSEPETEAERQARWTQGNLTSWELEHGIGPIAADIELAPIDQAKVEKGRDLYISKCATCHYLDDRKTGPPLRDITTRRSAEYVLNQILNPEQMGKLHPDGRKMVAQYAQFMTIQGITHDDAMALLDFLRAEADKPPVPLEDQPGALVPPPAN